MRRRFELSDEQWEPIAMLLPPERGRRSRPATSNRRMVNAMLWVLRTGAPWRDLPEHHPPWKSVYTRFSRWSTKGVRKRVLIAFTRDAETEGYHIDARALREQLRSQRCRVVIPSNPTRRVQHRYSKRLYKRRHLVENFFQRLKRYRRVATR